MLAELDRIWTDLGQNWAIVDQHVTNIWPKSTELGRFGPNLAKQMADVGKFPPKSGLKLPTSGRIRATFYPNR